MRIALFLFAASLVVIPGIAQAVDGVYEINETCAETTGCFEGDAPGWPVTIERSGSYRLTSSLYTGNAAVTAISITQSRVTLDLNGFEIGCAPLPFFCVVFGGAGNGIAAGGQSGITVRNGRITRFELSGILAGARSKVEDVEVVNTGGQSLAGISVGEGSIVRGCLVTGSGGDGILAGASSLAQGNTATDNGIRGIDLGDGGTARDNVTAGNAGYGIAGGSASFINNTVRDNTAGGILGQGGSMAIGNTIHDNAGPGMSLNGLAGYANNVLTANNGNSFAVQTNPEVVGGQQIGTNLCGTDTVCP